MKTVTTVAAAALLALTVGAASAPAAKDAPSKNQVAAKLCQAEKKADRAAFEATYGAKHTMRECKRTHRGEAADTLRNASQECRAERSEDPAAFAETYGTNENGKNAFGKCVSSKVKAEATEEAQEFKNAAKECRAERNADPEGFQETYGANTNKRNAFGKCVSTKVREAEETA